VYHSLLTAFKRIAHLLRNSSGNKELDS